MASGGGDRQSSGTGSKQGSTKKKSSGSVKSEALSATRNDETWLDPPTAFGDAVPVINMRYNLHSLGDVDTVRLTALVKFQITCYWTDNRLMDWTDIHLPPKLWTPRFVVTNAKEISYEYKQPSAFKGRVKMPLLVTALVDNPMELTSFPFDMDDISVNLLTGIFYRAMDGSFEGATRTGKMFSVAPVYEDGTEGRWIAPYFDGKVSEWNLHGVSTNVKHADVSADGVEPVILHLSYHLSRKATYYFWKTVLPLYLVTALSFTTFEFEVDDLENRNNTVLTTFLAAFAMLYVVGEALPKTDFLTKVDKVIVLSTASLVVNGAASVALLHISKQDIEQATRLNRIIECVLAAIYVLTNVYIFVPSLVKQWSAISSLSRKREHSKSNEPGTHLVDIPTVKKGHTYVRWIDI